MVTGAGGYVGFFLCRRLVETGNEVTGLCLAEQAEMLSTTGCKVYVHDLGSRDEIELKPVDAVIYLAQSPFYRNMPEKAYDLFDVNVCGLVKAADFARKAAVQKFIYASTGSVYRPSFGPLKEDSPVRDDDFYVLSKITGERLMDLYRDHFTVTTARFFAIFGPHQRNMLVPTVIHKVRVESPVFLEAGADEEEETEGLRLTPCFIDDAIDAIEIFLRSVVESPINIASSEVVSIKQIAVEAGRLLNREPIFVNTSGIRKANLIADNTLLRKYKPGFMSFTNGLRRVILAGE
jgi:UDP-glucose 4-epimerase